MNIAYEVTVADLIAFNLYHTRHSLALQRRMMIGRLLATFLTGVVTFAVIFLIPRDGEPLNSAGYVMAGFAAIVVYSVHPWLMRLSLSRAVTRIVREGQNAGMTGPQRLEISPSELISENQSGAVTLDWSSIEKIATTDTYVFLYVSSTSALIVPIKAFGDRTQFKDFIETIRRLQQGDTSADVVAWSAAGS